MGKIKLLADPAVAALVEKTRVDVMKLFTRTTVSAIRDITAVRAVDAKQSGQPAVAKQLKALGANLIDHLKTNASV